MRQTVGVRARSLRTKWRALRARAISDRHRSKARREERARARAVAASTMGDPVAENEPGASFGVRERDWTGLVRAVAARREEHLRVEALMACRSALGVCGNDA